MDDINALSPTAKRWLDFFGLKCADDVQTAIRTRIIAAGRRPGLTVAVVQELTKWATPNQNDDPMPTPARMTEIVTYFQCDDPAHRHLQFGDAQQCMVSSQGRSATPVRAAADQQSHQS